MRPISIRWFDRLFFAAMVLGMPFNVLETLQALTPDNAVYLLTRFVVPIVIECCVWFFISHRTSNVAKWLWVFWLIFPLIALPILSIMVGGDFIGAFLLHGALGATLHVAALSLSIAAAIMLFRPDAAKWFANRGMLVDASIFS